MVTSRRTALFLIVAFVVSTLAGLDAGQKKTVHVKGYTKKDGTYVEPYDRQAPTKKGTTKSGSSSTSGTATAKTSGAATGVDVGWGVPDEQAIFRAHAQYLNRLP